MTQDAQMTAKSSEETHLSRTGGCERVWV